MTHRFPIKEIARQAGLGTATVDRVLNKRAHVSAQTQARVSAAIRELEGQEQQLAAKGRRLFVDVVVEAPRRFSFQIERACETVLADLTEAVFRPRFHMRELMTEQAMVDDLMRIKKRGSHGVILKARDVAGVRQAIDGLTHAGIPVVTVVTDIPQSGRSAYVGIDNDAAGRTAAYLMAHMLPGDDGLVLTARSQSDFQGEAARYGSFKEALTLMKPRLRLLEMVGGAGLAASTRDEVASHLAGQDTIAAVYSMGGGNHAILSALGEHQVHRPVFVAHDLDEDNQHLLEKGDLTIVLHHDLSLDMRHAFRALSAWHKLVPARPEFRFSDIQVSTPKNIPQAHVR